MKPFNPFYILQSEEPFISVTVTMYRLHYSVSMYILFEIYYELHRFTKVMTCHFTVIKLLRKLRFLIIFNKVYMFS